MSTKYKIAVLSRSFGKADPAPLNYLLDKGYEVLMHNNDRQVDEDHIIELIGDADCAILGNDLITPKVIDACPNLKCLSKQGVGMDRIDQEYCKEKGIAVFNTPLANNESVADHTLLLMMAAIRDLKNCIIDDPSPEWGTEFTNDLFEKTVGLVGFGHIGRAVARRLKGFDCKILVYDPYLSPEKVEGCGVELVDLPELLRESDIVSLHAPLTEDTRDTINSETIAMMKPTAILVNTSRGGLINMEAFRDAIKTGRIRGAALDVFIEEPPRNEEILCHPHVLATKHIATHTKECALRMSSEAARLAHEYLSRI